MTTKMYCYGSFGFFICCAGGCPFRLLCKTETDKKLKAFDEKHKRKRPEPK